MSKDASQASFIHKSRVVPNASGCANASDEHVISGRYIRTRGAAKAANITRIAASRRDAKRRETIPSRVSDGAGSEPKVGVQALAVRIIGAAYACFEPKSLADLISQCDLPRSCAFIVMLNDDQVGAEVKAIRDPGPPPPKPSTPELVRAIEKRSAEPRPEAFQSTGIGGAHARGS